MESHVIYVVTLLLGLLATFSHGGPGTYEYPINHVGLTNELKTIQILYHTTLDIDKICII